MNKGFIKLPRKSFDEWLWPQPCSREYTQAEAWIDVLQMAAFKSTHREVSGKVIPVEPCELVASSRFLSLRWKWSKDRANRFINKLQEFGKLQRETRQGETVLKIDPSELSEDYALPICDSNKDTNATAMRQRCDKEEEGKESKKGKKHSTPHIKNRGDDVGNKQKFIRDPSIELRINRLVDSWDYPEEWNRKEQDSLYGSGNAKAIADCPDNRWNIIRKYLNANPEADGYGKKYFRPDTRAGFATAFASVAQAADKWAKAKGIALIKKPRVNDGVFK